MKNAIFYLLTTSLLLASCHKRIKNTSSENKTVFLGSPWSVTPDFDDSANNGLTFTIEDYYEDYTVDGFRIARTE